MRIGLAVVAVLLGATGCASSRATVTLAETTPVVKPPERPTLMTTAPRYSAARSKCRPGSSSDACAAHELLRLDRTFNRDVRVLWPMLDGTGRREFARGQTAWSDYVTHECDVDAREYLGGSEMPISVVYCDVSLTRARVKDVAGMLSLYCQGKVRIGPYRRCPRQ